MPRLSFTQPADFLKERDFGQKLEATFDFVRVHFRPLGKCLLYIMLPFALLSGLINGFFQYFLRTSFLQQSSQSSSLSIFTSIMASPLYLVIVLVWLVTISVLVLVVYGYMVLRMQNEDPAAEITVPEVWAFVRSRLLGTLGSVVGLSLFIGLLSSPFFGFIFLAQQNLGIMAVMGLLLPVLYVAILYAMVALSLFFIIWVREERGFLATLRRSFYLVWGKWWSTFGLIVVVSLILTLLSFVIVVPTSILNSWSIVAGNDTPVSPVLVVVANSISTFVLIFMYPLLFIALAFQYFNLVERKDGEGLRTLVDRLGQPASATPAHPNSDYYRPEEEGDY